MHVRVLKKKIRLAAWQFLFIYTLVSCNVCTHKQEETKIDARNAVCMSSFLPSYAPTASLEIQFPHHCNQANTLPANQNFMLIECSALYF